VLAGSVLEEHLRKLASRAEVDILDAKSKPKSVEALGVELRKAEIFAEVQRKTLSAWYSQRNEAAHGRSDTLVDVEVERMIDGLRSFIARFPA